MMKSRYKGIFFIIISAFSFALMNVLVRMSGDLPTIQKAFFRNFIALCIAAVILLKNRESISLPSGKGWWDMVGRSLCGTLGIFANFYAVDHLIVSDASMLNKLSPFFVLLFSFLMLKEKMKPFQVACVFMAFVGTLFVIKPGVTGMRLIPSLVGVSGGLLAGMAYFCWCIFVSKNYWTRCRIYVAIARASLWRHRQLSRLVALCWRIYAVDSGVILVMCASYDYRCNCCRF